MENVTRILVIRFSSIGDIVLTTPVIRALKTQLEGNVELHFLTKTKFAHLLEGNPNIDRIHTIEKTVQEILPDLEKIGFDYIIDLHRNIRSAVVKRRLKSLSFTMRKYNFRKWLWVNFGFNTMPNVHIVDRYMETLKGFGVKDDGRGLDYYIPEGKGLSLEKIPKGFDKNYIAFAIGGMHEGKKMSKEKIAEVVKLTTHPVILLGGKEDQSDGDFIVDSVGSQIFNASGKWTLHESADCIRNAHLVMSGDTGMMHIASAFGKNIISLWGCTVPSFGMYPYRPGSGSLILEPKGRTKRPCSKLGNVCKYGLHNKCIDQIDENEIKEAIERLWVL